MEKAISWSKVALGAVGLLVAFIVVGCGKGDDKTSKKVIAATETLAEADFRAKVVLEEETVILENVTVGDQKVVKGDVGNAPDCPISMPPEGSRLDVEVSKTSLKVQYDLNFYLDLKRKKDSQVKEDLYVGTWIEKREAVLNDVLVEITLSVVKAEDNSYRISWKKKCSRERVVTEIEGNVKSNKEQIRMERIEI